MMKRVIAAGSALVGITSALACCVSAVAAEPTPGAEPLPSRAVDKPMTKAEARFRALDENNDMRLSPQEFQADATAPTEFAKLDTDGDGFLSMSEFTSRPIPPARKPAESK
jgi:hypothetical protein